jgi:hypothetical protein
MKSLQGDEIIAGRKVGFFAAFRSSAEPLIDL